HFDSRNSIVPFLKLLFLMISLSSDSGIIDLNKIIFNASLNEMIEEFSRDLNPEKEIIVWENMAKVFQSFDSLPGYNSRQKKEAFNIILFRSIMPESELNEIIKNSSLRKGTIEFLLSKCRTGRL
ncbi:MAG: hypothetical protein D3916_12955, partial [Candidatus Electrothrix sp. MAN1_4]|nr:hypothetical protein [Candidatus Electrothrix sp. MAN1_4]